MATMATRVEYETSTRSAVMRPVKATKPVCGECRYHMPQATQPGCWCTQSAANLFAQPVTPNQAACKDFATWPEGSPVPAFLAAMGF
jgi:hypothetical protein